MLKSPEQYEFGVGGHFGAGRTRSVRQTIVLCIGIWAVQGFAVDAIDVDDAYAVDGGGDDAALRVVGEGGQAAMYVLRFVAADDGDAVVGFWPLQTQCQPIICRAAAGNLSWSSLSSL